MRYACPACAAPLRISDDLPPGKRIRCPKCKEPFAIPAAKPGPAEARAGAPRRAAPSDDDMEPRRTRPASGKRRFKPKKQQTNLVPVVAIVACVLVLGGTALGIGLWFSRSATPATEPAPPVVVQKPVAEPAPLPPVVTKSVAPIPPAPAPIVAGGPTPDVAPPPFIGKGALAEAAPSSPVIGLNVGNLAPEIEGEDIDGKAFRLTDYRGKVVVLDFWGNW